MSSQVYNPQMTSPISDQSGPVFTGGPHVSGGPQTIVINYPKKSKRREDFKSTPSNIIGSVIIVCGVVAIITQCVGVHIQHKRNRDIDYRVGIYITADAFFSMAGIWTAPFVFLAGAFAIVSAKTKRVGFIITTMVLSILAAVFVGFVIGTALTATLQEKSKLRALYSCSSQNHSVSIENNVTGCSVRLTDSQADIFRLSIQGGIATGVFLFLSGVCEFLGSIYLSTLCCRATCCKRRRAAVTNNPQVVFLPDPSQTNSQLFNNFIGTEGQPLMTFTGQQQVLAGAAGTDLPPPYTDSELQKGNIGECLDCPEKVPLAD